MAWTGFFGLSRKKTFILALIIGGVISGIIVAVIVITEATESEDTNDNSGSNYYYNQKAKNNNNQNTNNQVDQIEPYQEELIDRISCQAGYQALNGKCYQVSRNGRQDCGRSFVSDSVFFRAAAQNDVMDQSSQKPILLTEHNPDLDGNFTDRLNKTDWRIVNGKNAVENSIPWQVSFRALVESDPLMKTHFCGGSIISKKWLLTAAHCFVFDVITNDIRFFAVVGELDLYDHMLPYDIDNVQGSKV